MATKKKKAATKKAAKKAPAKKAPAKKTAKKTSKTTAAKKPSTTKKAAAKKKPGASATQLHARALRHNWDSGVFALERIVADEHCDLGTALALYWLGAPGFDQAYVDAKEVPSWRRPTFSFLRKLEARIVKRDFKTAAILFNPRFDRTTVSSTGHDWTAEYGDQPKLRPIPELLKEPSCPDADWEARGRTALPNTAARLT